MEIGISTATFFKKQNNEDCFEILRELDCPITEVFLNTYSEYGVDFAKLLAERKGDIKIHSVHSLGIQYEPQLYSRSDRVRVDAEAIYRLVLQSAKILGAKYITFHGAYIMKKVKHIIDYASLASRTQELDDMAKEYGTRLSYENVHYAYYNSPSFFDNMKNYFASMQVTLDIKQALQGGIDPIEFLVSAKENISTIHICDVDSEGSPVMIGKGIYNFEKFFEKLKKENIQAPVFLELYSENFSSYDELKDCYNYIKDLAK